MERSVIRVSLSRITRRSIRATVHQWHCVLSPRRSENKIKPGRTAPRLRHCGLLWGRSEGSPMRTVRLAFAPRFVVYTLSILTTAALLLAILVDPSAFGLAIVPLAVFAALTILGTHDLIQTRHAVLRNYP